jgi:aryl-alcohol dehydrogenase-like predicted oxidoreductase
MSQLPTRTLGRTGREVSVLALGGVRHNELDDTAAAALYHRALDLGIDYFDTAHGYKESERKMGLVIGERREELYLATKSNKRSRDGMAAEIEESLRRLQTDCIDCVQIHGLRYAAELAEITSPNGALKAIEEHVRAGSVRFAGVTGHSNPQILAMALREYPFDTVMCAMGAIHEAVHPFHQTVLAAVRERDVGMLAMKVMGSALLGPWEDRALWFALSLDGVASAVVGMDNIEQLEQNVAAARRAPPLTSAEQEEFLALARRVRQERDSAAWFLRPEHLGGPEGQPAPR